MCSLFNHEIIKFLFFKYKIIYDLLSTNGHYISREYAINNTTQSTNRVV